MAAVKKKGLSMLGGYIIMLDAVDKYPNMSLSFGNILVL